MAGKISNDSQAASVRLDKVVMTNMDYAPVISGMISGTQNLSWFAPVPLPVMMHMVDVTDINMDRFPGANFEQGAYVFNVETVRDSSIRGNASLFFGWNETTQGDRMERESGPQVCESRTSLMLYLYSPFPHTIPVTPILRFSKTGNVTIRLSWSRGANIRQSGR
jgi:hypothetical protein